MLGPVVQNIFDEKCVATRTLEQFPAARQRYNNLEVPILVFSTGL